MLPFVYLEFCVGRRIFFFLSLCIPDIDLSSLYYFTADAHSLALRDLYRRIHETCEVSI